MTILAALNKAYGRMKDAAPYGFSAEKIGFLISLNEEGSVANVTDLRSGEGKKKIAPLMAVPASFKRPGVTPRSFFLWDNSAYALGVSASDGKDCEPRHAAFRKYHFEALASVNDPGLLALVRFLNGWTPERFAELGWPEEMKDQNVVFALETERLADVCLHDREAARSLWARLSAEGDKTQAICLVTGEMAPVARLHPAIKGVWGAQSSGASIVSFNLDAFSSYGHEQGDNAPVSEFAAASYTGALNEYLKPGSKNRIQIGDASTVYWADASATETAELAEEIIAAGIGGVDEGVQSELVGACLTRIRNGEPVDDIAPDLVSGVRFHVLGLAPNAARLSVRYWFDDDFGVLAENFRKYFRDIYLEPVPRNRKLMTIAACVLRTAPARVDRNGSVKFDTDRIPDSLSGELFRAIVTGGQFPLTLLALLVQRVRADHFLDHVRASLLKALIVRKMRLDGRLVNMEDYLVRSDPDDPNPARRFGRLFALVERAQLASLGEDVNSTIKDKYLGSAAATPGSVFPIVCGLVQPHLARLRNGHADAKWIKDQDHARRVGASLERDIGRLVATFDTGLPRQYAAEDQALFFVGYYQERFAGKASSDTPLDDLDDSETIDETTEQAS